MLLKYAITATIQTHKLFHVSLAQRNQAACKVKVIEKNNTFTVESYRLMAHKVLGQRQHILPSLACIDLTIEGPSARLYGAL